MKRTILIFSFAVAFTAIIVSPACKKSSAQLSEFVADNTSFTNFMAWPEQGTYNGPDPLLGAMAHANNDSSVVRKVYFKNGQSRVNGTFPVGTIVVKHSYNPSGTVNEFTALVKRGNNFNPTHGDWEFFMLKSDGTIASDTTGMVMRGANLMSGMCASCHAMATNKDYIFSK
jgi:Cytochrome P460